MPSSQQEGWSLPAKVQRALPKELRDGAGEILWDKSGGLCFLCGTGINRAADVIDVDHDVPSAEGGSDSLENYNLVHGRCNKFKKNHSSMDVRPFLQLREAVPTRARYPDAMKHFGIKPRPSVVSEDEDQLTLETSLGEHSYPIFSETAGERTFRFAFVTLPKDAIFNDEEVQPRDIQLKHVWDIYGDIQRNPIYEVPGCRLDNRKGGSAKILMFDGQHKTIAAWLSHRDRIVVKLFLDIEREEATYLVNSIQSKIKKLSLSAFELIGKLTQEYQDLLATYLSEVDPTEATEAGFVKHQPSKRRRRAKQALEAARLELIASDSECLMNQYVIGLGATPDSQEALISQSAYKTKVLKRLTCATLLEDDWAKSMQLRDNEAKNARRILNYLVEAFVTPGTEPGASPQDVERLRRATYQSSLMRLADLCEVIVAKEFTHIERTKEALLRASPDDEQNWARVKGAIDTLAEHPIWTIDLSATEKTRAVADALSKNQNAERAFTDVHMTVGYALSAQLPDNWKS